MSRLCVHVCDADADADAKRVSFVLQAVTEEIYKLLESKCGLHKIILPVVLYWIFIALDLYYILVNNKY